MSDVWDSKDWCRGENVLETFEGFLLKSSPDPGFPFMSEQVKGGDNIGEIWNEFLVEVCKSSEQPDSLD